MEVNITLPILKNNKEVSTTFYYIIAISAGEANTSTIYTNGQEFTCTIASGELWNKIRENNASITRK